ncbi:MAG: DUF5655 domain-containing protein [Gemmatimonas sp.]
MSTPEEQTAKMITGMAAATGRSLPEWLTLAAGSGKAKHGEIVAWLKAEHGVTHGYANLIAHSLLRSDAASRAGDGADLVAEMFAGGKEGLRPIFDALVAHVQSFGGDWEQAPKKGYVSLRRKTQFATLHPSTKSRFDLGLKLKAVEPSGRLEGAGSWNAMVSHRVRIESVAEVDAEVVGWLRKAYEAA